MRASRVIWCEMPGRGAGTTVAPFDANASAGAVLWGQARPAANGDAALGHAHSRWRLSFLRGFLDIVGDAHAGQLPLQRRRSLPVVYAVARLMFFSAGPVAGALL